MTTAAKASKGVLLTRTVSATQLPVAELITISGPSCNATEIDVTNHDSVGDFKEFLMGPLDGGEITLEGNFIPSNSTGQAAIITDFENRTVRVWHIHFPAALSASFTFSGYVKSYSISAPVGAQVKFNATIKVSGGTTLYTSAVTGLTDLDLKDNAGNAVTISPAFAAGTYYYTATLDSADTGFKVTPTAGGTIYVNGTAVASGADSSTINVASGATIMAVVEAADTSKSSKITRVYVTRPSS
jgi:predicted secreted protein